MEPKKNNILVVDDDKIACIFVMKILSVKKDWQVDVAWKGTMALELVKKKAYDAVVLDYRMPGMDGAELCRRIREMQPGVRGVPDRIPANRDRVSRHGSRGRTSFVQARRSGGTRPRA